MKVRAIDGEQNGEIVLAAEPEPRPQELAWHRRLNLFPGRSLDDVDLTTEQDARAGRLRLAASARSSGVVSGLEADLERVGEDRIFVNVTTGFGFTASGEDITCRVPLRFPMADVPVFERQVGAVRFADFSAANPGAPRAGVLVIQPAEISERADSDPADQCALDPCPAGIPNASFEDQRRVDAGRVVFFPWPDTLLAPPSPGDVQFRNRLAWTVFRAEQALAADQALPWELIGLPIGLMGFDAAWQPLFVDRYSVVRMGGKALQTPLVPGAGNPRLWQAQILQFAEHCSDPALAGLSMAELAARFAFIPPFGILPRAVVDVSQRRFSFFSSSCAVQARPVPLDQLDAAVRDSAALAPVHLTDEAQLELLVPVRPEYYEPRLLIEEHLDPVFQVKLDGFLRRRAIELRRRRELRAQANAINRALGGRDLIAVDAPDPDALERDPAGMSTEPMAAFPLEDDQGDYRFAYLVDANGRPVLNADGAPQVFIQRLETLRAALDAIVPIRPELPELNARGLQGFIDFLQSKADQSDDTLTFGFLRVQADVFRVQKLILGKQVTSRLTTSPTLAFLQELDDGEIDDKILQFVGTLHAAPRLMVTAAGGTVGAEGAAGAGGAEPAVRSLEATSPISGLAVTIPSRVSVGVKVGPGVKITEVTTRVSPGGISPRIKEELTGESVREAVAAPEVFLPPPTTAPPVEIAPPISGARSELTNITINQRISAPSAEQARNFTVGARATVIDQLATLPINVSGIEATGVTRTEGSATTTLTLDQIRDRRGETNAAILSGQFDQLPDNAGVDESAFFAAGVRALDHTIATLRGVEGRIQQYRNAIQLCRAALPDMQVLANRLTVRLSEVELAIAEARQDVSVARMLRAEEIERLRVINERRRRVLADEVRFVAYRRPRHADALVDTPVRALDPGLVESPVPACLGRHGTVPPELQDMLELLRDAPARWFVNVPPILRRIDHLEALTATMFRARDRAVARLALPKALVAEAVELPSSARAVVSSFAAQERVMLEERSVTAQLSVPGFSAWTQARDVAISVLSLGDLIDGGHNRPDVTRDTSRELENIAAIAGCLYQEFGDVPPSIRLDWAERLSQFDAPVALRDLASLPRWGEIPVIDRKEIQTLVDWLFGRIDPRESAAVAFVNDLVRVCLLVASYAPVDRIIAAEVVRPAPVSVGGRVDIAVTLNQARLGMQVVLYSGAAIVAHGVVEDLVAGQAATRIVRVLQPNAILAQGARAQLLDPGRSVLSLLS